MAYNANTDYAAEMQKLLKSGIGTSDPRYKSLEQSRAEKIAAATPQQLKSWGVSNPQYIPTSVTAPVPDYVEKAINRSGYTPVVDPNSFPDVKIGAPQQEAIVPIPDPNQALNDRIAALESKIAGDQTSAAELQAKQQALKNAQIASRTASLANSRNASLNALNAQESAIDPSYYKRKNAVASASDIGTMNFSKFMASLGIKGNAGAMPEIYRNNALQNNLGTLEAQQQAEHSQIANNRTGIENAYQTDLAAAQNDVESQAMQAEIDRIAAEDAQRAADLAAQGKTSTGDLTLQGRAAQQSDIEREADLVARANYSDIAAEINRRTAINPNDPIIPYLAAARQDKINAQAKAEQAAQSAKTAAEQQAYKNALDIWKVSGTATADIAGILGVPVGARTADYDIAKLNAATAAKNANTAAQNANKPANADRFTLDDWAKTLDAEFLPKYDSYGTPITPGVTDKVAREQRILDLNLDPDLTAQLYRRYGIPIPQ